MKWFGISKQALAAAVAGAGLTGALVYVPQNFQQADAKQPITIEAPQGAPLSFADLVEKVSPAVVSVNVVSEQEVSGMGNMEQFFDRFRGLPGFDDYMQEREQEEGEDSPPRTREARSLGSGFFISDQGYIVTNNHVVQDATEIEVVLEDGRELEASLVGTDPQTDLAVIKVTEPGKYPYVEFETDAELRRGDWVVALGNPFGLGGTATAGILSADGRELGGDSPYTDFLQIDAAINRGNSGGPTFDLHGRVVGVNTAIFSPTGGSVGIGFAIPAELAVEVTSALIKDGKVSRGWLGVTIQDVTDDMAEAQGLAEVRGAIIADVNDESPARKAGLKRGDVILSVNGRDTTDATSVTRMVGKLLAGSKNEFTVLRDGKRQKISVTVGERPVDPNALVPSSRDSSGSSSGDAEEGPLGVSLRPLDSTARQALGLDEDEAGLIIGDIDNDSPLYEAGLRPGMAILSASYIPLKSVKDLEKAIDEAKAKGRDKILLAVRNGQRTQFVTPEITSSSED
ncbi:Do family serine endopeptidase [Henriciella mobilis]|uniref:Do family serine endopeptidase n=1 Tax=Henriciella mobilis TaxID=2305467 RepID=UPI000E6619EF|nr:Do family serine endopeptidase [Henriciella mobilis]RIJ14542.1 Do family serine endopeptidase [Henriciella mobilis]RIJ19961.1 Do family serine endopeptidase [Henriciella mobilis]